MAKKNSLWWNIWNIVVAVLFIGLGILTCAFSSNTDFQNTIILIVGIILLVIAGLQITFQVLRIILAGDETTVTADLSIAGVTASEIALGIVAIIVSQNQGSAEIVFKYLGYFLGILLLSIGAILVIYEIVFLAKKRHPVFRGVLTIIGALIPVGLGVLVMVFLNDQKNFLTFFFVCIGLLFIFLGLGWLMLTILKMRKESLLAKAAKEAEKAEEPAPVEATVVEEPKEEAEEKPEEPVVEDEPKPEEPEAKPEE